MFIRRFGSALADPSCGPGGARDTVSGQCVRTVAQANAELDRSWANMETTVLVVMGLGLYGLITLLRR